VELIEPPRVEALPERPYLGIRTVTPVRGMLGVRDTLFGELRSWLADAEVETFGHGLFRLHVIDMNGPMDIEVGYLIRASLPGDGRVQPGVLPAGRYATLTYKDHALRANGALIDWARDNELAFDRRHVSEGDLFACRYEAYRTDPKVEPRKTKWAVELAIKLAD
jgi:effector-binding domain-containing protein